MAKGEKMNAVQSVETNALRGVCGDAGRLAGKGPLRLARLDVRPGSVSVAASGDGGVMLEARVQTDDAGKAGDSTVAVDARDLAACVAGLPADDHALIEVGVKRITIEALDGSVRYEIPHCEVEGFVAVAGPATDGPVAHIPAEDLAGILEEVRWAAAKPGDRRQFLTGLLMVMEEGALRMVGCDGRVMATRRHDVEGEALPEGEYILPPAAAAALARVCGGTGIVDIRWDGVCARITGSAWSVTARRLEGNYPNWRWLIPEDAKLDQAADVDARSALAALRRACVADRWCNVVIDPDKAVLTFDARGEEIAGWAQTRCVRSEHRGEWRIDSALLGDALAACGGCNSAWRWRSDGMGPLVLRVDEIGLMAAVMPELK